MRRGGGVAKWEGRDRITVGGGRRAEKRRGGRWQPGEAREKREKREKKEGGEEERKREKREEKIGL